MDLASSLLHALERFMELDAVLFAIISPEASTDSERKAAVAAMCLRSILATSTQGLGIVTRIGISHAREDAGQRVSLWSALTRSGMR
ncbi:MAG: hypothetical protein ACRD6N_15445 [Pyrinomonadaceae bacterium]